MKSYYMEVPKLYAREPGPNFNVCLCVYAYIHCTFMHGHAVVGSDKKLVKYESKLLSNSHTEERLIVIIVSLVGLF